ncbi:MAG: exo-beta-N-acetylmuramidase NamZ domain-containing protein [Halanaerobium sp.]
MNKYQTGLENFIDNKLDQLKNKRIGLVTNHTGLTTDLKNNIDLFYKHPDLNLVKLFGPEHGVRGNAAAGDKIDNQIDPKTGLEMISLYGANKKPSAEMLADLDLVVFDIQDLGLRFYTYLSTLLYTIESCGENSVQLFLLDRMNPLGRKVEGNIVQPKFSSFIGLYPLPHRHGMTFGEIAHWANREFDLNAELEVIKCSGWQGESFSELTAVNNLFWIPPSPNIPSFKTAVIYPISCMLEGTNISEGRGTAKPFEYFGAPWIDPEKLKNELENKELPGLRFRAVYFIPQSSKHQGKECGGVQILVSDQNKVDSYLSSLTIIKTIFALYPDQTQWLKPPKQSQHYFFDLLMGTDQIRKMLDQNYGPEKIIAAWQQELKVFKKTREKYLIY